MSKQKRRTSWILWAAGIAFFLGSVYLFFDHLLIFGLFGLIVSFFCMPLTQNYLKEHHYNKNARIGIPLAAFGLMIAGFFMFQPKESDIPTYLKEYTHVSGTKVETFDQMSYMIDPGLKRKEKAGNAEYFPVKDQPVPVMIVSHVDHASLGSVTSFLNSYIPGQLGIDGTISNVLTEDHVVNGRPAQMATYAYTVTRRPKNLLSKDLIGETFLVPIQEGVYIISLFTYANDFNDYGYSALIDTVDLYAITHLLDVRDEMNDYLTNHTCPADAYQSECEEFEKYRQAIRQALDKNKTIEELEQTRDNAVLYENAIKARIQKDKEDAASLEALYSGTLGQSDEQQ